MALKIYWANVRTGGGEGALDKIPTLDWSDKYGGLVLESNYFYTYECDDDLGGTESSPWLIQPDDETGEKRLNLLGVVAEDVKTNDLKLYDTNASNVLGISWGEDDTSDRTITLNVGSGNRTVTLNENFTIGNGTDIIITGVTAARSITLNENLTIGNGTDVTITSVTQANALTLNEGFTIGDGHTGTLTFSGASKTLTIEDISVVNQDLTTDAGVTFATINALTLTAAATGFTVAGGTTPKTLTVDDNFVVSTQLAAIGANTSKVTESTTVTSPLVLTTYDISIPAATSEANGYMTSAYAGKLDGIEAGADVTADHAPQAHAHDGDTLQIDRINSNGGAFPFDTTAQVTFNQNIRAPNLGGGTNPSYPLHLFQATVNTSQNTSYINKTTNISVAGTYYNRTLYLSDYINPGGDQTANYSGYHRTIQGSLLLRENAGTIAEMKPLYFEYGSYGPGGADISATITELTGAHLLCLKAASTTITTSYGLKITGTMGSTGYGVYESLGATAINYFSGKVGVGVTPPLAKLHVDQSSTTAAIPVLILDQGDDDQPFINHIGTSGAGSSYCVNTTEYSGFFSMLMIEVNGVKKWLKAYSTPG